ncbi:MAG: hypothetical protein NYU90_04625 [Aigarchaeota archaeon]|nr:hypothetical protein [Candidatus Calditenuis fumarioli]
MTGEKVVLTLEAWRETFALRMLGRCYRLCYLLFTDARLIEMETDRLSEVVPRRESLYAKPLGTPGSATDLLGTLATNVLVDALYDLLGQRERREEREEVLRALSGDRPEDVTRFLERYVGPRMKFRGLVEAFAAPYADLDKVTVRVKGSGLRIDVAASGKRRRYELAFSDEERAKDAAERIRALALPKVEVL